MTAPVSELAPVKLSSAEYDLAKKIRDRDGSGSTTLLYSTVLVLYMAITYNVPTFYPKYIRVCCTPLLSRHLS
jgi:hypothetical protein